MDIVDYVIMAQGKTVGYHKLAIGDVNIIERTISMFSSFGNVHVVCNNELAEYFDRNSVKRVFTLNGNPGSLLLGIHIILTHKFLTSNKVVFLSGDVVFSHRMKDAIVTHEDTFPTLFGRIGSNEITDRPKSELFALSVGNDWFSTLSNMTFETQNSNSDAKLYELWDKYDFPIISLDSDYTDDIDCLWDYNNYYEKLREEAEKDDKTQH